MRARRHFTPEQKAQALADREKAKEMGVNSALLSIWRRKARKSNLMARKSIDVKETVKKIVSLQSQIDKLYADLDNASKK
jgi:transposase-like protein